MFERQQMKLRAKTALKRRYWIVVLVVAIVGLLGGSLADGWVGNVDLIDSSITDSVNTDVDMDADVDADLGESPWEPAPPADDPWQEDDTPGSPRNEIIAAWDAFKAEWNAIMDDFSNELGVSAQLALSIFWDVLMGILAFAAIIATLLTILFCNVIAVGGHGWMLRHLRGEDVSIGDLFVVFRIYRSAVGTMFLRDLFVWLWSLLFVIPGIVKSYAYSMVPYIIYENPKLSAKQALRISETMTDGYKWDLFVLALSFFGWHLLSAITGGLVGILWSNPYIGLTHADAYETLKWNAIQSGKLSWSDFGQAPVSPWGNPEPQQGDMGQTPVWGGSL